MTWPWEYASCSVAFVLLDGKLVARAVYHTDRFITMLHVASRELEALTDLELMPLKRFFDNIELLLRPPGRLSLKSRSTFGNVLRYELPRSVLAPCLRQEMVGLAASHACHGAWKSKRQRRPHPMPKKLGLMHSALAYNPSSLLTLDMQQLTRQLQALAAERHLVTIANGSQ